MADPEHLELLLSGVENWNRHRPETPDLRGADLRSANLRGVDLTGADMSRGWPATRTDLTGADLTGADLSGAILTGVIFTGANLAGVDMTDADLLGASLPDRSFPVDVERKPLSTFKLSKPPSEMTEEEIDAAADRILDQWTKDLTEKPSPDAADDA